MHVCSYRGSPPHHRPVTLEAIAACVIFIVFTIIPLQFLRDPYGFLQRQTYFYQRS